MSVILGYKFAAIPEWVLYHPKLTGDDVRLFGVLARYGNDVHPSRATVAKAIGKSTDTVDRCLTRLVAAGAVMVERRFDGETQLPNRYWLAGDEPFAEGGRVNAEGGGGTDAEGVAAPMRSEREQDNESKINESRKTSSSSPTPRKRGEVDEAFEAWWTLFPKKKAGKGQARERWRKMTAAERTQAVEGIERHVAWWAEHATDEQFMPAGNVWLNQRRWEDEEPRSVKAVQQPMSMVERARAKMEAERNQIQTGAR